VPSGPAEVSADRAPERDSDLPPKDFRRIGHLYCQRTDDLQRTFSLTAEYLRTPEGETDATNLMD